MVYIQKTRDVFLWFMSAIYLFAFSSLYVQIPGLFGDNGLLPARLVLDSEANSWQELLEGQPTLLKLTPKLGLDMQTGMDLLCLGGIFISFFCLISRAARDFVSFTLLWMFYLSLYQVGQTFLWFQWDILLLEAGFLTLLIAPFHLNIPGWRAPAYRQHDTVTFWLLRWLLFRLMFASGVVKLTSKCPTWWGLTALTYHFESQCIPTPLAWYWHHLPTWFLKLSCVLTYIIEIPVPFLFFAPIRPLRLFAFFSQVVLQVLIMLTGNYNFFNLLTIALCISLLDDQFFGRHVSAKKGSLTQKLFNAVVTLVTLGWLGYKSVQLFNLKLTDQYTVTSKIGISEEEFSNGLKFIMPYTVTIGALGLAKEILTSLLRCYYECKSFISKNVAALQCIFFSLIACGMFIISLVPHTVIHKPTQNALAPFIFETHAKSRAFHLTSSYGLFRRMTGVGGRPEVVIEGTMDPSKGWKAYEFLYKPGDLTVRPPIVAPHQPRLDWQMWFAALGNYQSNPWFINLVYRLLTNQPEVLELMKTNPFPNKPPKFVRATLYHYHFTNNTQGSPGFSRTDWWTREKKADYIPKFSKDDPSLLQYLKHYKVIGEAPSRGSSGWLGESLQWVRQKIGQPEGFKFVMSIFTSGLLINMLNAMIF